MRYLLLFTIMACGIDGTDREPDIIAIDEAFHPHIEQFFVDYERFRGKSLKLYYNTTIEFTDDLPNGWAAACSYSGGSNVRWIGVRRGFWKDASEWRRYVLIMHEIGHCEFNLPHESSGIMKSGYKRIEWEQYRDFFRRLPK